MEKKKKCLLVALLFAVLNVVPALAQQHIDKVLDELEQKGVDVTTMVKRNDKKQIYSQVKNFSFISKDGKFARELEDAFSKDAENASSESKSKSNGNITYTLIFKSEKKKEIYVLSIAQKEGKNPVVNVSVTFRDNSVEGSTNNLWFDGDIFGIMGGDKFQIQMDSLKENIERWKDSYIKQKDNLNKSKKLSMEI